MRVPCWWAVVSAASLLPAPAAAQAATVDQVLAALAEVVRDRAKQVASATIAARVRDQLCTGKEVRVRPHRADSEEACAEAEGASRGEARAAPEALDQPTCKAPLKLWLGGREGCRDGTRPCLPDDVFVRSCRLATRQEVPLTDPYYLKSLSRDALDFLMRVSASGLSEQQFVAHGLGDVAQYVHVVLEQVVSRDARIGDLADPTLALADQLSSAMPRTTLEALARAPETGGLHAAVAGIARPWVTAGCPGGAVSKACDPAQRPSPAAAWFPGATPSDAQCADFAASGDQRREAFRKLFVEAGAPFADARNAPCPEKLGKDLRQCREARLALNLHDSLAKVACIRTAGADAERDALRELVYVLGEMDVYAPTLAAGGGKQALDDWLRAVRQLDVRDLPREELAYGVRVLGAHLRALQQDRVATLRWLELLEADLDALASRSGSGGAGAELGRYRELLHGRALGSGQEPASAPVRALRGAVKDLLVLPALVAGQHRPLADAALKTHRALLVLVRQVHPDPGGRPESLLAVLGSLADFVTALSEVTRELAKYGAAAPPGELAARSPAAIEGFATVAGPMSQARGSSRAAVGPADAATLFRVADALVQATRALRLAADRDWVGLALATSDELERRAADRAAFTRILPSLRFTRVLLSMYQAADVKAAKAILEANLEDAGSRERRFDGLAVDVSALFAARWGYQRTRVYAADGASTRLRPSPQLYGLYAPFGVQATRRWAGLLLYPVDLGAYLVATEQGAAKPAWQDAFRVGVSPFVRFSSRLPAVFGIGGDVRPRVDDRVEWRGFAYLGIELPLYTLY